MFGYEDELKEERDIARANVEYLKVVLFNLVAQIKAVSHPE